ncbi:TPA: Dot/Icm T4SS effector Lem15, partial [Legionella pneumophila]|nr:Dot/Icm T4SS effector Lem15 [Legionella pneumophila]
KIANLIRELGGGNPEVPSLLNQCTFFVKTQGINIDKAHIPEELKKRIHDCNPL